MADVPPPEQAPASYAPILPGIFEVPSLNLLAGASGLGKTALLAGIAKAFQTGAPLFGHPVAATPRLGYISCDRGGPGLLEWFRRADVALDPAHFPVYSLIEDTSFDLQQLHRGRGGPALFAHCVEQLGLPPGSVILADPIALFLGGRLNDYTAVALACIEIQRYLAAHPYCVIGVCHTSKLKADVQDRYARPQDRILGSMALLGYSATQMYFMGPDEAGRDDGQYLFSWNSHSAPEGQFLLRRNPTNGLFLLDQAVCVTPQPEVTDPEAGRGSIDAAPIEDRRLQAVLSQIPYGPEVILFAELEVRFILEKPQGVSLSRASLVRCLSRLRVLGHAETPTRGKWRRVRVN